MFVRRKVNRSGSISVHVVDKSRGGFKVIKTFGTASTAYEADLLEDKARQYIREQTGQLESLFGDPGEDRLNEFIAGLHNAQIQVAGPELIFGALYDRIGYDAINNELFRHLVICRLFNPGSKLRTIDYLQRYLGVGYDVAQIYRFLDKLCVFKIDDDGSIKRDENGLVVRSKTDIKAQVERISFEHTKKVTGGSVEVVFYDMTTLYFEAAEEDDLRKAGFSKDGKHSCPQIFLGLLVTTGGNPIGYEIYEGNIFEGHTLIHVIEKLASTHGFSHPIVIADAGLLSKDNIKSLEEQGYKYILGARPKNESKVMKEQILGLDMKDGDVFVLDKTKTVKLVVSKTDKRAAKDAHNREKGLARLEKKVAKGQLTKACINNRGYNKYLKMEGEVTISIDMDKFNADAAWDGIKAYLTNTDLSKEDVIANYGNLWYIERAFRIGKGQLEMRPMFHFTEKRIEAHICICFVAYKMYKELERIIRQKGIPMSVDKVLSITKIITTIRLRLPNGELYTKTLYTTPQHEAIRPLIDPNFA